MSEEINNREGVVICGGGGKNTVKSEIMLL